MYLTRNCHPNYLNQLKFSIENDKIEELKSKSLHGQFYWDLEKPSIDKENPRPGYVAQT
jgi:hypothetical protein